MKNVNAEAIKGLISFGAGSCAGYVVQNALYAVLPPQVKFAEKVVTAVGVGVFSTLTVTAATEKLFATFVGPAEGEDTFDTLEEHAVEA